MRRSLRYAVAVLLLCPLVRAQDTPEPTPTPAAAAPPAETPAPTPTRTPTIQELATAALETEDCGDLGDCLREMLHRGAAVPKSRYVSMYDHEYVFVTKRSLPADPEGGADGQGETDTYLQPLADGSFELADKWGPKKDPKNDTLLASPPLARIGAGERVQIQCWGTYLSVRTAGARTFTRGRGAFAHPVSERLIVHVWTEGNAVALGVDQAPRAGTPRWISLLDCEAFRKFFEATFRPVGGKAGSEATAKKASPAPAGSAAMYYVNPGGDAYHRAGCKFVTAEASALPLAQAASGRRPCRTCQPPSPQ